MQVAGGKSSDPGSNPRANDPLSTQLALALVGVTNLVSVVCEILWRLDGISHDMRKLARTPTIIKKKKDV